MNCHSFNSHLGDLIWALTAMSRLPEGHVLRCHPDYVKPLNELAEGLRITVFGMMDERDHAKDSFNCWIASGLFATMGLFYRDDTDILGFVQRYFNEIGKEAGLGEPFPTRESMLCDFPSITTYAQTQPFNGILVVNCDPKSGQCPRYSSSEMDALIERLHHAGHSVLAVEKAELSLVQIGALSTNAKLIIGCATGPWWPTMNVWNKDTQRICMLSPMKLDYGSVPIVHAADAAEVATILTGMGYL